MDSVQSTLASPVSENGAKLKSILAQAQTTHDIAAVVPDVIHELKEAWQCEAITLFGRSPIVS